MSSASAAAAGMADMSNGQQQHQDGDGDLMYDNAFPQLAGGSGGPPIGGGASGPSSWIKPPHKMVLRSSTVTQVNLILIHH